MPFPHPWAMQKAPQPGGPSVAGCEPGFVRGPPLHEKHVWFVL